MAGICPVRSDSGERSQRVPRQRGPPPAERTHRPPPGRDGTGRDGTAPPLSAGSAGKRPRAEPSPASLSREGDVAAVQGGLVRTAELGTSGSSDIAGEGERKWLVIFLRVTSPPFLPVPAPAPLALQCTGGSVVRHRPPAPSRGNPKPGGERGSQEQLSLPEFYGRKGLREERAAHRSHQESGSAGCRDRRRPALWGRTALWTPCRPRFLPVDAQPVGFPRERGAPGPAPGVPRVPRVAPVPSGLTAPHSSRTHHRGLGRSCGRPHALPRTRRLLLPPSPQGDSHLSSPADPAGGHAGSVRSRGRGRHGARPRAKVATPAQVPRPPCPVKSPPSRPHAPSSLPRSAAGCGGARDPSTYWRERLGMFAALPPELAPFPPASGPALSVPPTAAPAAPPRRAPAGGRGQRSPRGCRPPLLPPSTPACRRTLAFPVYLKGVTGPGGRGFPSPHLPAADARVIIARLNKAATQVRGSCGQPAQARASLCRTTRPGRRGTGKGRGKGKQSGEPRLKPGILQDGGDRRPPTPPAVAEGLPRVASARCRPRPGFAGRPRAGAQPLAAPCLPTVDGMRFYIGNEEAGGGEGAHTER
ncbi:collagen alpha-1(I) chain-like [Corvus moneduloides]|uniref:collagen alpha-1(I) chain-like n=1 Tax=Corvus moneduloides TaxID=1196302 RepID=UPI0013623335|nr:collagen alpha-1(I) chain-like [Corvus moneduloides]